MAACAPSPRPTAILALASVLALAGCATSPRVEIQRVDGNALADCETFAIRPDAAAGLADPALGPEALRVAQEELTLSLRGRSYRLSTPADAQLLVAVGVTSGLRPESADSVMVSPGYDVYTHQAGIGTPLGGVPVRRDTVVVPRTDTISIPSSGELERTVVVDVFDARTQQLLWRGTSTIRRASRQRIDLDELRERVRAIAGRFPGS